MEKVKYQEFTFRKHATKKGMWMGAASADEYVVYDIKTDTAKKVKVIGNDRLYKYADEIITNAVDHYISMVENPEKHGGPVRNLWVKYESGKLTVTNDGPGFRIHKMDDMWSVEKMMTKEFSGSNLDDESEASADRVVGGTNGVGSKLIFIHSLTAKIITVSKIDNLYYEQEFHTKNGDLIAHEPIVVPLEQRPDKQSKCYTKIILEPNYPLLMKKWDENPEKYTEDFKTWIKYRCAQIAIFCNAVEYRHEKTNGEDHYIEYINKLKVHFNGEHLDITPESWIKMIGLKKTVTLTVNDPEKVRFPWYIIIALQENSKEHPNLSLVNAVHITETATHTSYLEKYIKDKFKEKAAKLGALESGSVITNNIMYISVRHIPIPDFVGQNKTKVKMDIKEWNSDKKKYEFDEAQLTKLWNLLKERIEYAANLLKLNATEKKTSRKNYKHPNHTPAVNIGKKGTMLIFSEGNSAEIASKKIFKSTAFIDNVGFYTGRGVLQNILKNSKKVTIDGEVKVVYKDSFYKNMIIQGLFTSIGLSSACDYFFGNNNILETGTPEEKERRRRGDADFDALHYKMLVSSTDQDLDGAQITGLAMLIIYKWPELYKRNFFRKYMTPLARVTDMKTRTVKRFYSDKELDAWIKEQYEDETHVPKHIKISRIKGLGQHTAEDIKFDMVPKIREDIFRVVLDKKAQINLEIFYDKDTEARKKMLLDPTVFVFDKKMHTEKKISLSNYLYTEVKPFQLYTIQRKLNSYIDGLNLGQRKVIAYCRNHPDKTRNIKTSSLVGGIINEMDYHHGEASAIKTIIYMAQAFIGSNNVPPLTPFSVSSGDVSGGREKIGEARYCDVGYNKIMDLLYPKEDDPLLEYNFIGNKQIEPVTYVPIYPAAITETKTTPSTGWKINFWGRDFEVVKLNLKLLINSDTATLNNYLKNIGVDSLPNTILINMNGKVWAPQLHKKLNVTAILNSKGKLSEVSHGEYSYDPETRVMSFTTLPFRYWSEDLKAHLEKVDKKKNHTHPLYPYIEEGPYDQTKSENEVKLWVKLTEGGMPFIEENYENTGKMDFIEKCFDFYREVSTELNFTNELGTITSFASFEDVMKKWYVIRRNLYFERIARGAELEKIHLILLVNKLRYILSEISGYWMPQPYFDSNILCDIPEYLALLDEKVTDPSGLKEFNITAKTTRANRCDIIESQAFKKINSSILRNISSIKRDALRDAVFIKDANYAYIDSIRVDDKDAEEIEKLRNLITKKYGKILELMKGEWKKLWLGEIDAFVKMFEEGMATNWKYEKYENFTYT